MKIRNAAFLILFLCLGLTRGTAEGPEIPSLENLAVPQSLGKVESQFKGAEGRWIIHIQDVHAHLPAQQNIAALVEHLHNVYHIETVAIEGTWLDSTLPKSWGVPAGMGKQMLAETLLEEDYISGAIHAAIFSQTPLHLVGLEDEPLYWENGKLYLDYLKQKEDTLQKLGVLEQKLQASKENIYNPDLLKFDGALMTFRTGKKADEFLPMLLQLASIKDIDLSDLAQIQTFQEALALEKSIDPEKLKGEGERLKAAFKHSGMGWEELLKSGKVSEEKLAFYPQVSKYAELMKIQEKIQHREFFTQLETAVKRLKDKMARTTEEIALDKRSEALILAKKIMTLQATPSEVLAFKARELDITADLQRSALEEALATGLKFYEAAQKRDVVFAEKILKDPRLQGNIAVITGGFHTEGLSEQLEKNGVSYTVITPDLGKEAVNEALYHTRIRENLAAVQTFTDVPFNALSDKRDAGFAQAAEEFTRERNIVRAKEIYLSFRIGEPSTEAQPVASQSNFLSLSNEEQTGVVQDFINAQKSAKRIFGVIRQSVLVELLKDPVAQTVWRQEILSNRQNTLVIIQDTSEVFSDTEGGANIKLARGEIQAVVKREQGKMIGKDGLIGVIDPEFQAEGKTVVLRPHPAALLLLRPLLEQDARISGEDQEALDRVKAILQDLYRVQGVLISA